MERVGKMNGKNSVSMGKVKGSLKNSADMGKQNGVINNSGAPVRGLPARHMSVTQLMSLSAVNDIEKLAQKRGANSVEERFKVVPDYAYPNTRMNRAELRLEMNKKSSYLHDLGIPEEKQTVGQLTVEILQCFGIPKPDLLRETSAFCVLVCGSHAFKTDVMPPVANPMWLSKMRRACTFPIHNAYARLYIGVFGQGQNEKKDGFAGRIVIDISRLRPNCTYDVTIPLRQSTHIYSREQRGAIRLRFHLNWISERGAILSYLPRKVPKIEPIESVSIQCCDTKSFQNVARVVHGIDMPGKFSLKQMKSIVREINFTRIHILRYMRKNELRNTIQWKYPIISGFVFFAWMHCVYMGSIKFVPGHLVTFLLMHLWKNYAYYALDSPVQNGFLAPTWEEMFSALLFGTGDRKYIEPLEMEMKDGSAAKSPLQDMMNASMDATGLSTVDESVASLKVVPLKEIAEALRSGVQGKKLRHHLKKYRNAFCGTDAVDFLVNSGFAASREKAVMIGRRLAKELKVFEHVSGKHIFKDEPLYYAFLAYDINEYGIKTHRPLGKSLFRMLGFLPGNHLAEAQMHIEMPYSDGVDHPRFTVKDSLVIRSKESQRLLSQETEDAGLLGLANQTQEQLAHQGLDDFLDEDKDVDGKSTAFEEDEVEEEDDGFIVEIKVLNKPPQQDINIKGKGGKKLTDQLAEARHKVHGILLHAFNDRTYKIDDKGAKAAQSGNNIGISQKSHSKPLQKSLFKRSASRDEPQKSPSTDELKPGVDVAARKDDYNKLLAIDKYSHGNPWVNKVGVILQPIVEIALEWLCLFRALFNIFTWRDPILSFWISIIGPVLVVVLHLFPWRWVMGIVGLLVMGPQNWLLRVMRERKEDFEPYDVDKIVKKKRVTEEIEPEEEELPLFSMYAPDNRPVNNSQIDPSNVRKIVVPYSPLMYQRFYDWPPENEYARVRATDPPTSDPYALAQIQDSLGAIAESDDSERSERSRWRNPLSLVKGMRMLRRRKKNGAKRVG